MHSIPQDFHGWLLDQAAVLRARNSESLEWGHLAEELESMGACERRELNERLKNLLLHLLKLRYQSALVYRHQSWRSSVREARQ